MQVFTVESSSYLNYFKMTFKVNDKVFFVTGGASGIGAEVVKLFVSEASKFVVIFDINEKDGVALQNELNSKYGNDKVRFIKGDVTNDDEFIGSLEAVKEEKGLDVLVNNAGLMNESKDKYKKVIDVNVTAVITGTMNAIRLMRKDDGGSGGAVINVASVAVLTQDVTLPIYFSTKSAVAQFSNCVGSEEFYYKLTGVRVMVICFGLTETPAVGHTHTYDPCLEEAMNLRLLDFPCQKVESAGRGLLDAYKQGENGSTWLVTSDRPAKDISNTMKEARRIMSEGIFK